MLMCLPPHRFIEALKDPKIYIFMVYAALANFVGGIGIQYSLIIKAFGFDVEQTTLLNIPSGGGMVICVTISLLILHRYPVSINSSSITSQNSK